MLVASPASSIRTQAAIRRATRITSSASSAGTPKSACDLGEAVAGLEAVDEILNSRAAVNDERLTERLAGVDGDLGLRVRRQP